MMLQAASVTSYPFVANQECFHNRKKQPAQYVALCTPDQPQLLHDSAAHQPSVTVVIPTLNEARNLPHVLPLIPEWVHEVIVVDGHSVDDTIAVAHRLRPNVRVIMQQKRGKGAALISGFLAATGEIIVALDADGSTDPTEIDTFVSALLQGADFVKGSRFLPGGGTADMEWYRNWGNRALLRLTELAFGGHFSELCYGYIAFWRHHLPVLHLDVAGFEIETLMHIRAIKAELKIAEVPSFEHQRIYGQSNLNTFADGWKILRLIAKERISWHKAQAVSIRHLCQGLSEWKPKQIAIPEVLS